jgi:GDP-4-dehydro-6-deoxy-D-mannose reductase
MRVLVTGANGFVGRHLVRHLADCGDAVLGIDLEGCSYDPSVISKDGEIGGTVALDILDAEKCGRLISEFKPEAIYHLAGIAFVPEAENNFDQTLLVNVGGTNNIIRPCHLLQLSTTFVYISSAEVYGRVSPGDLPLDESVKVKPANNYSLSKFMGELLIHRYDQFGFVKSVILRPFNHIGAGQNNRFVVSSFAYQLSRIARGQSPPVIKVGNLEVERDFSDVRDVVKGYRRAALSGSGVYNLCSGRSYSIQLILDLLIEISGLDVEVTKDSSRVRTAEMPKLYGSYQKAKTELGWNPEFDIKDTLKTVYQYWLER